MPSQPVRAAPSSLPPHRQEEPGLYYVFRVELSTAQNDREMVLEGAALVAVEASDDTAELKVEFNRRGEGRVSFRQNDRVETRFRRVYLTNTAQAGKWIDLAVVFDHPAAFDVIRRRFPESIEVSGEVDVSDRAARQLGVVTGPLTDAQLRASAVPVSGPLTDAQLRATAVPVSGPLTDAQLRATAVPVSGPLTDAQLRASAVPVSGPLTDAQLAVRLPMSIAHGKTLKSKTGTVSASGDNELVAAVTAKKIRVYAYRLSTSVSTLANICIFKSGTSELWSAIFQPTTGSTVSAGDAVTPPAHLFETAAGNALNLNLSQAQTVRYAVSYFEDD